MEKLSDAVLKETYIKAIKLKLDKNFILILENELKQRGLLFITKKDKRN
ncbi:sporulation histidine kinase inhibitor Sda [Priestia megaterium]